MTTTVEETAPTATVPGRLIREVLNGRPLYYKGYREVLAGHAEPEAITGSSDLQSLIVMALAATIWNRIDRRKYRIATSEAGMHISPNNNFAAAIAIFDKATLPALKGNYFDVAPKLIVEVDIRIDWDGPDNNVNYILEKSQTLFDFGVERVLWVLTTARKIIILQPDQDTIITDWSNDVPVLDGHLLNIKTLLDEEDITF